jgi:hypothetical protein
MSMARLLPADAVQDGELVVIPELFQRRHVVRDAVLCVEMHDPVVRDPDRLAVVAVQRVGVGDHRIEVVVTAGQLQHDNDRVLRYFLCCRHRALLLNSMVH